MINSRKIEDLKPAAQAKCLEFLAACAKAGLRVQVIQTLRDAEYQHSLYEQGRTKPGKIVTNCDGYTRPSKHQSGLAWDAVPLDGNGNIIWSDRSIYAGMAKIAAGLGITAGYNWHSLGDLDHFQVDA